MNKNKTGEEFFKVRGGKAGCNSGSFTHCSAAQPCQHKQAENFDKPEMERFNRNYDCIRCLQIKRSMDDARRSLFRSTMV